MDEGLERVYKGTRYSLQAFSSDWSLHSNLSLQKSSLSIHSPFPQDSFPSGHTGSSVLRMGITFLGSADQHSTAVICWVTSQLPLYIYILLCGLLNEAFNGFDLTAFTDRNVSTRFMWKNVVGRRRGLVRAANQNCGRRVWGQSGCRDIKMRYEPQNSHMSEARMLPSQPRRSVTYFGKRRHGALNYGIPTPLHYILGQI